MSQNSTRRRLILLPLTGGLGFADLVKQSVALARQKDIVTEAAAIAFYAMIAMVPILVVMITTFTLLIPVPSEIIYQESCGTDAASVAMDRLKNGIRHMLPRSAFNVVDQQIERIRTDSPVATLSIGIFAALWTASGVFGTICKCMNFIHDRAEDRSYLHLKLLGFSMAFLQCLIFVLVLIAFFLWPLLEPHVIYSDSGHTLALLSEWFVFTSMVLLSFTILLKVGPTGGSVPSMITPGALLATPIFLVATWLFRTYIQNLGNYHEMYGPLGGVMVLMLWFWIVAIILLSGSVVDCVIARHYLETGDLAEPHQRKRDCAMTIEEG